MLACLVVEDVSRQHFAAVPSCSGIRDGLHVSVHANAVQRGSFALNTE